MEPPKVLLFDLGGVIVRWVGFEELAHMTGQSRDKVGAQFAASPIFQAYETGRCGDDIFADTLIAEFDLDVTREEAKTLWNSWVQETYSGTKMMLTELRKSYKVACLSNTNALHWKHLETHIRIKDYFDYSYASHLIHVAKPEPESYLIPIKEMDVHPSEIWFFDDTLINIQAARDIGMKAHHVDRTVGVIPTLKELGLLR
jgi:putative hydrolase of the HAD superfamily